MEEVKAYRCGYCGKVYLRKGNCKKHEKFCYHNPDNARPCYNCKYQSTESFLRDDNIFCKQSFYCKKTDNFMYPPLFEFRYDNVSEEYYANNMGDPSCPSPMPRECKYYQEK